MNAFGKQIEKTVTNYYLSLFLVVILNLLVATLVVLVGTQGSLRKSILLGVLASAITMSVSIGIYIVARANQLLQRTAYELHEINHVYRDVLCQLFSIEDHNKAGSDNKQLLLVERATLTVICGKIANIFRSLTGHKCVVTVKLITEKEGELMCFTWARSEQEIFRNDNELDLYSIKENTGFAEAQKIRRSETSYFYCEDLVAAEKRGKYVNQRVGWKNLYKSAIIVPIRHIDDTNAEKSTNLGFLCVDTRSRFRLKGFYVQYLAAFADQMYNFLSLMRQRYHIPETAKERKL